MSRSSLLAEHVLLFYGLTGLLCVVDVPGGPIPVLLVAAAIAGAYLMHVAKTELWRACSASGHSPAHPR
ncbi:hypothetical protein [Paractinoplanes brasiliensis]|uniref:Uncharacterized protein n=1 Tax=Paractinoplanes brasiliensis TaxID=52695 RepID=A0A4R6JQM0_9ACTN|nr:hypothetical protein [Actinoplanes brasiliensis]TDO36925.1 hypothetical protein C8E87_0515 [Actinoplanes brasiliensis]GID30447.1 hypothetical protein Abr02nite_54300 [Actinoplanes brasiliensis]